jgi:hypothetical protein
MLVGMAGRAQRPQPQATEVDLVTVAQAAVGELAVPGRRSQHPRAFGRRQLPGAGQEVRVQVRVGGERDRQPPASRGIGRRAQVEAHVDHHRPAVAEID